MAVLERENVLGFVDKRVTQGSTGSPVTSPFNFNSVAGLRSRLTAANAGYYTTARLDNMTKNDMVYALRTIDEAAGI